MKRFSLPCLSMALVSAACGGAHDVTSAEEPVILGRNDLVQVEVDGSNVPERFRRLLPAFGRIMPMGCTATYIGDGLAVTAGHCFRAAPARETGVRCTTVKGQDVTIEWGYRGLEDAAPESVSECSIVQLEFTATGADYALLRVSKAPPVALNVSATKPLEGERLTIFSHPARRPLEWSKVCSRGVVRSEATFKHSCDTEGGSSGAAVLNADTLEIVGIHNGGYAGDYNYATYVAGTAIPARSSGSTPVPARPPYLNETGNPFVADMDGTVEPGDLAVVAVARLVPGRTLEVLLGKTPGPLRIQFASLGPSGERLEIRRSPATDLGQTFTATDDKDSRIEIVVAAGPGKNVPFRGRIRVY
jgi:hypothetical protein